MKELDFSLEVFHKKLDSFYLDQFKKIIKIYETDNLFAKYNIDDTFYPENVILDWTGKKYSLPVSYWKFFIPELSNYLTHYIDSLSSGSKKFSKIKYAFSWINVFEKGDFFHMHSHDSKTQFSGVIFINVPDGICSDPHKDDGGLFFRYGNMNPQNFEFNGIKKVKPIAGDLYLFPSWLTHGVMPHYLKDKRISMAFNVEVELA